MIIRSKGMLRILYNASSEFSQSIIETYEGIVYFDVFFIDIDCLKFILMSRNELNSFRC